MNWLILIIAGLFEVVWAVALKMSNGFKNITADAVFLGGMAASVWLLAVAMKSIPTAKKTKNVLIILTSFRPNSNSHALCLEVAKGVKAAGNEAVFDLGRRI